MWPFAKKYPARADIRLQDDWKFQHTQSEGKPLITRFCKSAKPLIGHPEYTHRASITVVLNDPAENGLTQEEENLQLRAIEGQLRQCLEVDNESLRVGAITTNGMKAYVFYTANPDGLQQKFDELQPQITSHRILFSIDPDEGWELLKWYV